MPAAIFDLSERIQARKDNLPKPFIPTDIVATDDGSWGCSTDTMIHLIRWFEQFGYEFDPTCLFEDMVGDLCAILRASALLGHIHALPSGSPYFEYLHAVRKGNPVETAKALIRLNGAASQQVQ